MRRYLVLLVALLFVACGTPAAPTATPDPDALLRREASTYCPSSPDIAARACIRGYVAAAQGDKPSALCRSVGAWYIETPRGRLAEKCSDGKATIVRIIGGN